MINFITVLRPYAVQLLASIYKQNDYDLAIFSMGDAAYVKICADILEYSIQQYL